MRVWIRFLVVVIALVVLVRCDRQSSKSSLAPQAARSAPGTFSDVFTRSIKGSNCNECHRPGGSAWVDSGVRLDFNSQANAYQGLLTTVVSGKTSKGICPNVRIISPNNPAASYFMAVLFREYNKNDFGGVMNCKPDTQHFNLANLTDDEKASIRTWIQNGAKNN